MKYERGTCFFFVCLLLLTFLFVAGEETFAQSNQFILEKEQHWETYRVGGTCIGIPNNLFVTDVDDDGIMEIITGGYTYNIVNSTFTDYMAPLKIWNWNGQNITLEKTQKWPGFIICLYAGDANGDGIIEIITTGISVTNNTRRFVQIRLWHWDGETLDLKASYEETTVGSTFISDVDKDGTPEIFTVGRSYNDTQYNAQLSVWHWDGKSLTLNNSVKWGTANATSANSVHVYDLDNDGVSEIITGGYANDLKNSSGQLRIWQWKGEELSLRANEEWRLKDSGYGLNNVGGVMGNTVVNDVKVGDVDSDGSAEIVTGGFAYDGEKVAAQLRIWSWNGQELTLEGTQEWTTQDIVEARGLSINDVDRDWRKEIVTSGVSALSGSFSSGAPEWAQLRVWSWDGKALTLENSQDWFIDEGSSAQNVATGDVDNDGIIEIVTVGCTFFSNMCDPDMRIWSVSNQSTSPPYTLLAAVGIVVTAIVLAAAFLFLRKKRQ